MTLKKVVLFCFSLFQSVCLVKCGFFFEPSGRFFGSEKSRGFGVFSLTTILSDSNIESRRVRVLVVQRWISSTPFSAAPGSRSTRRASTAGSLRRATRACSTPCKIYAG